MTPVRVPRQGTVEILLHGVLGGAYIQKNPEATICRRGSLCGGRTDDVMKLLMVGFEGLFHLCNPSASKGWHAIGGQSWSRFLDLSDEYPDQTSAAVSLLSVCQCQVV